MKFWIKLTKLRYQVVLPKTAFELDTALLALERNERIIVPVPLTLANSFPARAAMKDTLFSIENGVSLGREALIAWLTKAGYERETRSLAPHQFSVRGDRIEVGGSIAIDFFGDQIETLSVDGKSTDRVALFARRFLTPPKRVSYLEFLKSPTSYLSIVHDRAPSLPHVITLTRFNRESLSSVIPAQAGIQNQEGGTIPRQDWVPVASGNQNDNHLQPILHFHGNIPNFTKWLANTSSRVVIVTARYQALTNALPSLSHVTLCEIATPLGHGFIDEEYHLAFVTDADIFGTQFKKRRHLHARIDPTLLATIRAGDYVVHIDHGIGRYRAAERRTIDGIEREYLILGYAEGDRLSVPVDQAHRVMRYIGGKHPVLHRLHGELWLTQKARARKYTEIIAKELLATAAKRELAKRPPMYGDPEVERIFAHSFPFVETEDQARVIDEVLTDLKAGTPMDRLVAGEVGFGKTEVAMRAALRAALSGSQVALLAPTTVLVEQHVATFNDRFSNLPVRIAHLSRMVAPRTTHSVIEKLARGEIDIIIGTHRLLSKDIKIPKLGLLIIDEEQKFGVKAKEHFKNLRALIDILTLTATPIPRTLHLALSGIRDLSSITTPPPGRLPIETHVRPYEERVVIEALARERARTGQVFYLHNRVETIENVAHGLRRMAPGLRMAVAHGKLPAATLRTIIERFRNREFDLLLCSTIIENGIDMANVNTLIVDYAERFGLSQLHQLRGRIGRGDRQAYCYLLYRNPQVTPGAEARLTSIEELKELGSGLAIATRDMEIRGVGNILGKEQHGVAFSVGLSLYAQFLREAVARLKAEGFLQRRIASDATKLKEETQSIIAEEPRVAIELPLPIAIPTDYIIKEEERINAYQMLALARTDKEREGMRARLSTKYGEAPEPLRNLVAVLSIQERARRLSIASIRMQKRHTMNGVKPMLVLEFSRDIPSNAPYDLMVAFADKEVLVRERRLLLEMPSKSALLSVVDTVLNVLSKK
ncbi:MAG: transcription-repair coupling factor [Parcubacteria group bacterium]|nr:transcription-repair coupling factor [Parcubacteria group bacterium]